MNNTDVFNKLVLELELPLNILIEEQCSNNGLQILAVNVGLKKHQTNLRRCKAEAFQRRALER